MTKETKEMLMNVFSTHSLFWNVADPAKPLTCYSVQINIDITIWKGSCLAMHDQYIL